MKKLVVLVAGLLSVPLFAQAEETQNTKENTFSMKVQIRPRAEYRNGVLFPRPKDAESTGFRCCVRRSRARRIQRKSFMRCRKRMVPLV